jgi:hypothetical protein
MKKLLSFLTVILLAACGGGGGGGADQTPIAPPPPPLTIDFADSSHSTDEDVQLSTGLSITTNRSANLSYSLTNEPDYGSVSFSGTNFTYTPDANYYGSDEFEVTASAEGVSDSAKISLTINSINDVPVLEVSLVETDDSEYPLQFVSDTLTINLAASDVETENLTVTATATFAGTQSTTELEVDLANQTLGLANLKESGPMNVLLSTSDGEATATASLNFWRAVPIENSQTDDVIYNLYGDSENTDRGFRYVLVTDSMPDEELQLAVREAFKFYFYEFLGESQEMSQIILDTFNVAVIEPALNTSPINVVINEEIDCRPGFDPNVFCITDIKPRLFEFVNKFFPANYFDNYSIITGKTGRGVNGGNANIQHIGTTEDGICGDVYCSGPRRMLKTLKHEFGHGYLQTGDGYVTDFQREDDDGNPLYGQDYWESYYYYQDQYVNTTYVQNVLDFKWVHLIADTSNVPSDDNASDTSNEAIGKWTGCYSNDTYCYRASYNSIMNGDKGGATDWLSDGTRVSSTNYDPIDREAFVIQSWVQQGLHDIASSFDTAGNLVVSHSLKLNPNFYEVRWYVDGEEQTQSINASSITVSDNNQFVSIAYRVVNVKEDGHVQVVDAIEVFDDVHDSIHTTFPSQWFCDSFKDVSNLWDGLTVRTYCKSGLYFVFKNGFTSYWPGYARNVSDVKARNDISYVYERSGRGAQIIIDLGNFGG